MNNLLGPDLILIFNNLPILVLLDKNESIIENQNVVWTEQNIHCLMGPMVFSMSHTAGAMNWKVKLFNFQK